MAVLLLFFRWLRLSCNGRQSRSYSARRDVRLSVVVVVVEHSQMRLWACYGCFLVDAILGKMRLLLQ